MVRLVLHLHLFKSGIDHSLVSPSGGDGGSALSSDIIHYVRKRATTMVQIHPTITRE